MDKEKIISIFLKSDEAQKKLLEGLVQKQENLKLIQQNSYFLEKMNEPLFFKIVKDVDLKIKEKRAKIHKQEIVSVSIKENYLIVAFKDKEKKVPFISFQDILQILEIPSQDFSGKNIQVGFALRTENFLDLCMWKGLENDES